MKKTDLHIYRSKINKLHKAALALKEANDEYEEFQEKRLLNDEFSIIKDLEQVTDYLSKHNLTDKIEETEKIINDISKI